MNQPKPSSKRTWSLLLFAGPLLYLVYLMQSAWTSNPDLGHGWLVACFGAAWVWTRWQVAPAVAHDAPVPTRWQWLVPLGVVILLLPLRMFLVPYPDAPAPLGLLVSGLLCLWVFALRLIGGGAWLRHFIFLAPLLLVSLPLPSVVQGRLMEPLREGISWFVAELLNALGYPTSSYGTTLRVAGAWVGLDEACGGIRSLQLSWALALVVGELGRLRLSRRAVALLLLSAAAIFGNTGRVLFLSLRAAEGAGPKDPLHDASGYATYAFVALVGFAVYWIFRDKKAPGSPGNAMAGPLFPPRALRWLGTLCGSLVALEAITLLWWKTGDDQGWRPSWTVDIPEQSAAFEKIPLSREALQSLAADKYMGTSWMGPDYRGRVLFYGEWRQGRAAEYASTFHNPTICFPASGCQLERSLGEVTVRVAGKEIPFNGYLFSRASQRITAYFTVWDVDEQDPVRLLTWREYWAERLGNVLKRRSQFRMQLVTLAFVEEADKATPLPPEQVRAEIERLLKPVPDRR